MNYLSRFLNRSNTPQSEAIDPRQVQNRAGGFVFALSDLDQVRRFLILGCEGATYYASERKMVLDNAQTVLRVLREQGPQVVRLVTEISVAGRAPKNDAAIFVLAMAIRHGDDRTRVLAYEAVPQVCRIGTHLFALLEFCKQLGKGESRGLRSALQKWYLERDPSALAFQAVKYQQRGGWSHRDVLRLAHPKTPDAERNAVLHWVVKGWPEISDEPPDSPARQMLWAMEKAKRVDTEGQIVDLIRRYRMPFEAVPTRWLASSTVWQALIPNLGYTALIRNLGRLTANGALAPLAETSAAVATRLRDRDGLHQARVHPIQVLSALKTYEQGCGDRGKLSWKPLPQVVAALNEAFYLAFDNVDATGKRWFLGLDISGSMWAGTIAGVSGLTPAIASAAMAMVTVNREPQTYCMAFTGQPETIRLAPGDRLDAVLSRTQALSARMGRTDCAQPMLFALKQRIPADVFVVYTDNETWAGDVHPVEALRRYRQVMQINARLIVVGMTATKFTIADPLDGGMLDVVGFDTATPTLMSDFVR